jgi:hypothetical protein
LHPEKDIILGHKHLAPGNIIGEKEWFLFGIFKAIEGKLLFLQFNLEAGRQSYRKIPSRKRYHFGAEHLASGNRIAEKE